ncbi:hypothetical protein IIF7_03446 [Zunongwangia atlantica 22II14-10F7]|uniref:Uncharacterized protein n=1 Tax=Zunongwangia atlantica 22II14-10F7 TaxID=1185767 RepID=A0A1Y1T7K9_9FLAO|nr:hypothetical protein IIF7_03446 [Zunongwangia atlantica 22II14-10F7]
MKIVILKKENLPLINIGQKVAFGSFTIGTIIFLLFYQTELMLYAFVGFIFFIIAIPLNTIFLLRLLYQLFTTKGHQKQILITVLIVLLNIPISYIYYIITIDLAKY